MATKDGYTAMDDPTPKRKGKSIGGPGVGSALGGKLYKKGGGVGKAKAAKKRVAKKAAKKR